MSYYYAYMTRKLKGQEYNMPYSNNYVDPIEFGEQLIPFTHYSGDDIGTIAFARKKFQEAIKAGRTDKEENPLVNEENYWIYAGIAHGEPTTIETDSINKDTWSEHYKAVLSILKDGIETEHVQSYKVHIIFPDNVEIDLCLIDYYFNLIMWNVLVMPNTRILSKHLMFELEFRSSTVKNFFDIFIIDEYREKSSDISISNIMSDTLTIFHDINDFADYLCNTLNLEDSSDLMREDPIFYQSIHNSYKNLPVDRVDDAIMHDASVSIERIKQAKQYLGYDHCIADCWRANEGINPKQYAETQIAIGNKPDGKGGIFPTVVDTSFTGGGVSDPMDYFIESSTSRIAQIEKHKNVSKSGTLARIMGLSSMDSHLYPDEHYDCHTRHLVPIQVKTAKHLKYLDLRYYRETPNGQEKCINYKRDTHLIGRTILLRSPCTCASAARGQGICYKCYGKLAYTNVDSNTGFGVNIGRIASEFITSKQTQTQLSAKHILKAVINKIEWCPEFSLIFEMDNNVIRANSDIENYNDYKIIINPDSIESDNDVADGVEVDDDGEAISGDYDEYVTEFWVKQKSTGQTYHITTKDDDKLFITKELNVVIKHKSEPTDDNIVVPLNALKDAPLFIIKIQNNEISKTMIKLKNLFNRSNEVRGRTIHDLLQELQDTNIEGNMDLSSIHYEVILMNQIADANDVLEKPNWLDPNPAYRILTLDEALTKNPSVTISLSYQKITKALYTPLTFKKHGASFMDLFFMKHPQLVIRDLKPIDVIDSGRKPEELYNPFQEVEDIDKFTTDASEEMESGKIDFEE